MERLTGIGVSPGIAVGSAVVLTQRTEVMRYPIPRERIGHEIAALDAARERSRAQLHEIRDKVARARGADLAALFDAQLLMLDDPLFVGRAMQLIETEQVNAAWAVHRSYEEILNVFQSVEDPYLREREGDVADVAGRVRLNLRRRPDRASTLLSDIDGPAVLLADELTASMAAQLDWTRVLGFATDAGSRTYHTAILARSLKVPAVVGLHDASARVRAGTLLVLDGNSGEVLVDPDEGELGAARQKVALSASRVAPPTEEAPTTPTATADGTRVVLQANVELLEDLSHLRTLGAEGIGLYRSEFLLASRPLPDLTEEVQFATYRQLLEAMAPYPVTIRTFDLDERQISRPHSADRRRARGGLRGLRLGLARPDLLRTQLRALLRASEFGSLRILFPFVTGVEEVRLARSLLASLAAELNLRTPVPVGIMIEVPAAALAADLLAAEVDFFTIGTNDLIQYCLAVDRTDDRVSTLYEPLHPAVLRLIRIVRRAAARRGIAVSLCGEMASDPAMLGLLIGLGLHEFSMTPTALPIARDTVREVKAREARRLANHALRLPAAADIEHYLFGTLAGAGADGGGRHDRRE